MSMPVDGVVPLTLVFACAAGAWLAGATRPSGALAGLGVGLAITAGAGWPGFTMLLVLLVGGTLLSAPDRRGRGALQVLCNGGVAALCALAAGSGAAWGLAAAAGALGAAFSDTVAGEVGQRWGGPPRRLLLGRAVARGADGGMTVPGTLAGAAAALVLPAAGAAVGAPFDTRALLGLAAAGFGGNLLDSVLGLAVQPRLGARGNDWVNLAATTGAAALATLL